MRILDESEFKVISLNYNSCLSRRIFYKTGQILRRGMILGFHVSYHLKKYPGTNLLEISVSSSLEDDYYDSIKGCHFKSLSSFLQEIFKLSRFLPVVGVNLHHRYYKNSENLSLLEEALDTLKLSSWLEFSALSQIYQKYKKITQA